MHGAQGIVSYRWRYGLATVALLAGVWAQGCGGSDTESTFTPTGSGVVGSSGSGAAGGGGADSGNGGSDNSSSNGGSGGAGGSMGMGGDNSGGFGPIGGDRPVSVHVPPGYNPNVPIPLVLLLHGYTATGDLQELYMDFSSAADEHTFLYARPNGTVDEAGLHFWNATDACCNFFGSTVDDSAYLRSVIDDIKQAFNVDEKRVYLIGHSNGGFMSHRMACEHSDAIAAVATLAGATWDDPTQCQPQQPVAVLTMHGTLDTTILYPGGSLFGNAYPGALETSERWAQLNGCSLTADMTPPNINVSGVLIGDETQVRRWDIGCNGHGVVEHWRIPGGGHAPIFSGDFTDLVIEFLYAHPKL